MLFALWIVCLIVQTIYLLLFSVVICFSSHRRTPTIPKRISIIVASHNELSGLRQLLPVLLSQESVDYEIIIGLDRSNDGSKEFLEGLMVSNLKIVNIEETPSGWDHKKYALTKAIEQANGDWLVYTDADCIPQSRRWLASFSKRMQESFQIILGVSPYFPKPGLLNTYIRYETYQTAFFYIGSALLSRPYMAVGRNFAVEKNFFLQNAGYERFKQVRGGDDDLFVQKFATPRNTTVNLDAHALVFSEPKSSWPSYFSQKLRHFSAGSRYRIRDLFFLGLFHWTHLLFMISVVPLTDHKYFWIVLLFYLTIKLVSFRFVGEKLGIRINYLFIPIVDVQYAILTPVLAFWSKLKKDIPWKN